MWPIAAVALTIPLSCLGFVTMFIGPAWGCSCAGPTGTPQEIVRGELAASEAVFAGEVVRIEGPPPRTNMSSGDPETVTFRVSEVWKGQVGETSSITTAESSASCGYPFNEESSYLVYTDEGRQVSLCGSTELLSGADADLKVLGEGSPPTGSDLPVTSGGLLGAAMLGSVMLVAGIVILWLRRSS